MYRFAAKSHISVIAHKPVQREYHTHLKAYNVLKERSHSIQRMVAADFGGGDPDVHAFNMAMNIGMRALTHKKAYNLLQKITLKKEIDKEDYDNELIDFINVYRKEKYSAKSVYDKFDDFVKSVNK